MLRFFKTTMLGGVLFLVPIIVSIGIIGKALELTNNLATRIAGRLGAQAIAGFTIAELLAIGILVLICFLAGLTARTPRAKKYVRSLEDNILKKIPAYDMIKVKLQSALELDDEVGWSPVMAKFDDSWQLAFEIERIGRGNVVIFLPGAPDPWSGSMCVMTKDRITPLDLTAKTAVKLLKRCGRGAGDALRNPQGASETSA